MSPGYTTFLAAQVFNEGHVVTYRSVSRELKVHANAAKKMLYDFYTTQNAKKSNVVHATYLITGWQEILPPEPLPQADAAARQPDGDGDVAMPSSPPLNSSAPQESSPPAELRKVLTLVREEQLDAVKAKYEDITAIHIYSLEPGPLKNMQLLSTANLEIATKFADEDPLESYGQYGVIHNPNVKRRTRPQVAVSAAAVKQRGQKSMPATTSAVAKPAMKVAGKPAALKKESSDLFKSFAKAKSKAETKQQAASTADVAMKDASDDDEPEEPLEKPDMNSTRLKAERQSREERLRALMDEDDNPMSDPDEDADGADEEPEPEPEPEAVEEPALTQATAAESVKDEEPVATISDGRRRGRRKIMKKVTMKDEEGYLITKEEPAWESFSEDEAPSSQKSKSSVSSGKPKSSGAKGQGNIMSFFGKK